MHKNDRERNFDQKNILSRHVVFHTLLHNAKCGFLTY